jgi:hypothetical protein
MKDEETETKFGTLNKDGKIENEMSIDLNKVDSPDPIAYSYGFFKGINGQPMSKDEDLAEEYIRGFNDGKKEAKK